ncbi:hypothetical protein K438DRAFT_573691 [Mycena galopus ATCC 62051]|nr:hypothetical protein K438DRAFT_573691 [Mycena galopus ATCC 62051]
MLPLFLSIYLSLVARIPVFAFPGFPLFTFPAFSAVCRRPCFSFTTRVPLICCCCTRFSSLLSSIFFLTPITHFSFCIKDVASFTIKSLLTFCGS